MITSSLLANCGPWSDYPQPEPPRKRHLCATGPGLCRAMTTEIQTLRDRIAALGPWHHDVEVVPGVRTGAEPERWRSDAQSGSPSLIDPWQAIAVLDPLFPNGLEGRSFLDCGCNAGGYVFAARQRGAGRCFGFDARDHWIDQANFLARHLPSEGLAFQTITLDALPATQPDAFDITWFSGLFYHLPDPVAGLKIAADLTRDVLVLNTATVQGRGDALVLNLESQSLIMSGVDRLAWMPTGEGVLRHILSWCGFPHAQLIFEHLPVDGFGRIMLVAAREAERLAPYARVAASLPGRERRPLVRRALSRLTRRG